MTVTPVMKSRKVESGAYRKTFGGTAKWSVWHIYWVKDGSEQYEAHRNGRVKCFKTKDEALEWARR